MQQLMKSMREATQSSGMLENSGTQLGTEMLDSQYAMKMTGLPGGPGRHAIARQLERQIGHGQRHHDAPPPLLPRVRRLRQAASGLVGFWLDFWRRDSVAEAGRLRSHEDAARAAESATGIPAAFMVAQAAHECRLGPAQHQERRRQPVAQPVRASRPVPAGPGRWPRSRPPRVVDGQAQKVTAKFRAYASDADSFADYAKLMKESPRYAAVVAQARAQGPANAASAQSFANGLQRAGYGRPTRLTPTSSAASSTRHCAVQRAVT